jgi:hypothetical protein
LEKKPTRVGRHRGPAPYFFRPTLTFKKVGRRKKDAAGSLSLAQLVELDATLVSFWEHFISLALTTFDPDN